MVEKFESGTPPQERGGIENKELAEQGIATLGKMKALKSVVDNIKASLVK